MPAWMREVEQAGIASPVEDALANVLLARWLTPEAYGAYTVAFTVFLLFSTVHQGLLTEPMLVFGPGKFKRRLPTYFSTLLRAHGSVFVVGLAALGMGALIAWALGTPPALAVGRRTGVERSVAGERRGRDLAQDLQVGLGEEGLVLLHRRGRRTRTRAHNLSNEQLHTVEMKRMPVVRTCPVY